ncbi:gamma-glutamylcyclotransferase [Parvularcula dongshanensis]|uniref:Gamma-glutamylcyclotransferase n=1 Tax=Parvularcula dongshanensis TaxID=1173995 RepID=A0A840I2H7_9PROT|nr:gamma-glutamylcyclotransferase [Parvularcula dongshanensis]MBB4659039.1 hypothetical protein [Parvularcula dongshanensis]
MPLIAGYGSLLSEASARETVPDLSGFELCRIRGYKRVFDKVAMVFFERHGATADRRDIAALSTRPAPGFEMVGCRFHVPDASLPALFEREHRYRWVMAETVGPDGTVTPARMTTATTDEDYLLNKCVTEAEYERRVGRFYRGKLWREDVLPFPTYLAFVLRAVRSVSEAVYDDFLDTTFLADGETTIRTYLAETPDWDASAGNTYSYLDEEPS